MDNVIGIAFIVVFAAQLVGTIAYLVNVGRLFRHLEEQHKAVHESIGSPLVFANNTPRNNLRFFGWIWNREYETVGSADTVALAKRVRWILLSLLCGFVLLIVLFLILNVKF